MHWNTFLTTNYIEIMVILLFKIVFVGYNTLECNLYILLHIIAMHIFKCLVTEQRCSGVWRLNKALLLISGFIWRHPDQILPVYGTIQNSWHRRHHFDLIRTVPGLGWIAKPFFCNKCRSSDENIFCNLYFCDSSQTNPDASASKCDKLWQVDCSPL